MTDETDKYNRTYEECKEIYGEGEYRECGEDCVNFLELEYPGWSPAACRDICARILDHQTGEERFSDTLERLRSEKPHIFEPEFNPTFE
jgi:hypothetical protein